MAAGSRPMSVLSRREDDKIRNWIRKKSSLRTLSTGKTVLQATHQALTTMAITTALAIDKTITLNINGSTQRIRLCAARADLPPLLVVQAGPGLPMFHEVTKFQRRLSLERDFLVGYWEQRGCGIAPAQDARSVSFQQQVDDLRAVLQWLHQHTTHPVVLFGISLGGAVVLRAAEHERDQCRAVVLVSPDLHTAMSDAAVHDFLQQESAQAGNGRLSVRVNKLAAPPYVEPAGLQQRARLLADLGTIERGKRFSALLREMLFNLVRTYGLAGAVKALRNMTLIQRKMLPELVSLDLLTNPSHLAIPVHYVFGEQDALNPATLVKQLSAAVAAQVSTVTVVPDAGHMVHFDQPAIVRSIALSVVTP